MSLPLPPPAPTLAIALPAWTAQAAFVGVFLFLILVLATLPPRLAGESDGPRPWWRQPRLWAIAIATAQIALYAWWG